MKRISTWISAPVLAVAATLPTGAAGQDIAGPFSLRAGASTAGHDTGSGFQLGISRNLGPAGRVDLDHAHHSRHGNRRQTTGLAYVHQFKFGSAGKFYGGLGVGVYNVSVKSDASGAAIDSHKVTLGGKVLVGFNFTNRVFVEAGVTKVPKISGLDASNLAAILGVRF